MRELTEYRPEDDPAPDKMDGKMTRYRSRWLHDTAKALWERNERELAECLEQILLTEYFFSQSYISENLWLPYPISVEEFYQRFRACIKGEPQAPFPPTDFIHNYDNFYLIGYHGEGRWFMGILLNVRSLFGRDTLNAWIWKGIEGGAPEDFLETLTERYYNEWGEGEAVKQDRPKELEFSDSYGIDIDFRYEELHAFEEIAKKLGHIEKANLIHQEYVRVGKIPVIWEDIEWPRPTKS